VLVVEAALKSGSLITARCALGQDREVFAIPGSIHNPQAKGCHLLIKQGAQLVEQVDELVAELAGPLAGLTAELTAGISQPTAEQLPDPASDLSEEEAAVFQSLGFDAEAIDSLSSPFDTTKLAQLLVSLELKGLIANDSGFYRRLV
jgi:DNA processing protein